jgi:hypothetical protein
MQCVTYINIAGLYLDYSILKSGIFTPHFFSMKFRIGEKVLLLDTDFRPVCNAVIKEYNSEMVTYLVEFRLSSRSQPEQTWVPQERLTAVTNVSKM